MKRCTFFPVTVLLGLTLCCCSADVTRSHKFVYDMANDNFYKSPSGALTVDDGDLLSLELINVNPFVYDITINERSVSYNTDIPPLWKLPTPGAQLPEAVPQTVVLNVENSGRINVAAISRFGDMYADFRRQYTVFSSFVSFDEYLYGALKRSFVDEKAFKEEIQSRLVDVAGGSRLYTRTDFINKGEEMYASMATAYSRMMNEYQLLDENSRKEVKVILNNASAAFNSLAAQNIWTQKVGTAADVYTTVLNTPFTVSSFKTQAEGDGVRFIVNGQRKNGAQLGSLESVRPFDLEYNIKVNGSWLIDFSSGLLMSNLVDESYAIQEVAGIRTVLKKRGDILNYGPGVLMHFYYQPFGTGVGLGLYANNFGDVQYVAVPSFLLGKNNQFCLSGGVTVGKVTRLADGLTVGGPLPSQNSTLDIVPTSDRLDWGWYGGVSYNFTSIW